MPRVSAESRALGFGFKAPSFPDRRNRDADCCLPGIKERGFLIVAWCLAVQGRIGR